MLEVNKSYIDTIFKTPESNSYPDFTIELHKPINIPDDKIAYTNDVVLTREVIRYISR